MDMSKELSFGDKKQVYPVKKRINLAKSEVSKRTTMLEVGLFVVFAILLGIGAKFAVIDPLMDARLSSHEVMQAQKQLDDLLAANSDYSELTDTYSRYVVSNMTEQEQRLVSRDDLLDLLKTKVLGTTYLSSVKVTDNSLVINCAGVGLQEVAGLVQSLETDTRVAHVTVSTAQSNEGKSSSATIEVLMKASLESDAATSGSSLMEGATNGK